MHNGTTSSQVSRLVRALISLGLTLCLPNASVYLVIMLLCIFFKNLLPFCFTFFELSLVGLAFDPVD